MRPTPAHPAAFNLMQRCKAEFDSNSRQLLYLSDLIWEETDDMSQNLQRLQNNDMELLIHSNLCNGSTLTV